MAGLSDESWVVRYASSHTNPVNKVLHMVGIPLIAVSIVLLLLSLAWGWLLFPALVMFAAGWMLQFIGHAFEGKRPEFFNDWRFLFVGLRWWFVKMRGLISGQR